MSMFDFESWSIDIRDNLPVEYTHTHDFFARENSVQTHECELMMIVSLAQPPSFDAVVSFSLRLAVYYRVRAWVGQIVTFFAYSPPSRPLGSLTPTQPGRVTETRLGAALGRLGKPLRQSAGSWLLRREPKPPA